MNIRASEASPLDGLVSLDGRRRYVLTQVSICWFSLAGLAVSVRIYYELSKTSQAISSPKTSVPVGMSFFSQRACGVPQSLAASKSEDCMRVGSRSRWTLCGVREARPARGRPREDFGKSGPGAGVVCGCSCY